MRTVKILGGLVGAIIVLIGAGLLTAWLSVSPNDYKARITAAAQEATGRELKLPGPVRLSVIPWVGLELGPGSLKNPAGFGEEEPFLAFNHVTIRVRLWPLLMKRLVMDRVEIDGLNVRLRMNDQGVGNWQGFGRAQPALASASASAGGAEAGGQVPKLGGIEINDGRVSYQGYVLEALNLETGAIGGPGDTPISISFVGNRGVGGEQLTGVAKFDVRADSPDRHWRFAAVNLSGLASRRGDAGRPAHWELSAPAMEMDVRDQSLAVPAFSLSYSSVHLTGKLQASTILDDFHATGALTLAPLVLREIAPRLGIALPETNDPRALAQFAATSNFSYDAGGVRLEQLQAQLDDTNLKGNVDWTGEPRGFQFDLAVDQLDVDRYLGTGKGRDAGVAKRPGEAAVHAEDGSAEGAKNSKLPEVEGTLSIRSLHLAPLDFANVRLTLASKDNVVHLFPALAQIDGGSYSGNITIDHRGEIPLLNMDEHLSGIEMTRLLAGTSNHGRLTGRGNVNVKATARGGTFDAIVQTLNGQADASLADGALEGIDLAFELGRAQALVKRAPEPTRRNPPRTKFDAFKMSAEITKGVARTSDLTISSQVLRVTGQGSANLVNKDIDLQMLASILQLSGARIADIPLKITGTYTDPTVRPDVDALLKGEVRQKLQDVLKKNGLEGLFGK
jgi:AsmA protein